jgi:uncharacterized protein (DUF1697 family)
LAGSVAEKIEIEGTVIFWSALMATFSRTRWSRIISTDKTVFSVITMRNANTALKLAELAVR